jgi:hypothetical protein
MGDADWRYAGDTSSTEAASAVRARPLQYLEHSGQLRHRF